MYPVSLDAEEVSNEPNELAAGDSEDEIWRGVWGWQAGRL